MNVLEVRGKTGQELARTNCAATLIEISRIMHRLQLFFHQYLNTGCG